MNEPRLPDALDRRIEESLRRRFVAPASLDTLAERARSRGGPRLLAWPALAAAAAAGVVLAFAWRAGVPADAPAVRPDGEGVERVPYVEAALFCSVVGPVLDGVAALGAFQRPDLARIYRDMEACQASQDSTACGVGDDLAQRLSATYGQPIELCPGAAGLLHGPFGSEEWPTGTIVIGRTDGETSVLVADRGSTMDCCVHLDLAEESGLQFFTWKVGDLFLTEITPSAEPRLIAYFE